MSAPVDSQDEPTQSAPSRNGPGRPIRLPDDPASELSGAIDPWARVGWLLSTSRSLHPDLFRRDVLTAALRERGVTADLSRVSRWEAGRQVVPISVVLGYEELLGIPRGTLVAATRSLLRASVRAVRVAWPPAKPQPDHNATTAPLLDRATSGQHLTGADWLFLAMELERLGEVILPTLTWKTLCDRVVDELTGATEHDLACRYEACVTLIAHPSGGPHLTGAIEGRLGDPDLRWATMLTSLLQYTSSVAATELLMGALESGSIAMATAAELAVAEKMSRRHFDEVTLSRIEQRVRTALLSDGARRLATINAVHHLPEPHLSRLLAAVPDPRLRRRLMLTRARHDLVDPQISTSISRNVARRIEANTHHSNVEPDRLLHRLVRESLFHPHAARRQLACWLLLVSRYRDRTADQYLRLVCEPNEFVAARGWDALLILGLGTRPRTAIAQSLDESRPSLQRRGLMAVALHGRALSRTERQVLNRVLTTSTDDGVRSAAAAALGLQAPLTWNPAEGVEWPSGRDGPQQLAQEALPQKGTNNYVPAVGGTRAAGHAVIEPKHN